MIKYPLSDYTGVPEELRNGDWLPLLNSTDIEQNPANGQPILTATGVVPGTYGDAFNVAQFTVDAKGRISFAGNVPLAAASGTVSNVSATDGNGFDFTITTPTTTPVISLTTQLTQGSVPFITATKGLGEDNALFFWDNTNKRLGIGTNTPAARLQVLGAAHVNYTFTHTAIGGVATYITNTVNVPAAGVFNNGAVWAATLATNNMKFAGSVTTGNGAIVTGMAVSNTIEFTAAGAVVTVGQATGIRALAGLQILSQTLGSFSGTVSHGASLMIQGVYTGGAAPIAFDNYYGILINRLDEWGALTITNRWAIYQQYSGDPSYFAGQIQINNTTSQGTYKLQVTGGLYANVTGFKMRFLGLATDNAATQVLAKDASGDNVWRDSSSIVGAAPSLTATYVGYGSAGNTLTGTPNMTFDNATGKLTLNTATGRLIQLGNAIPTSTATPVQIHMGGTFSNTAGANLKLVIFDNNTGSISGMGMSNTSLEYVTPTSTSHRFYSDIAPLFDMSTIQLSVLSSLQIVWEDLLVPKMSFFGGATAGVSGYNMGVATTTLYWNVPTSAKHALRIQGADAFTISGLGATITTVSQDDAKTNILTWDSTDKLVRWRNVSTISSAPDTHTLLGSAIHTDTVTAAPVLGAMIYGNATPAWQRLDGHTVAAKRFLTQTGTGVVSAVPVWGVIAAGDIPDLSATYVPTTRTLTINGSAQDLSTNRTWTITVTGTANRITVTGGAGLTPTIDIAATYAGQASIITVGTITTGTWNGTAIGPTFGGTGITTYTLGDTLYASATNVLSKLAGNITTAKLFLSQTGTGVVSAAPAWSALAGSDITGAALTKTDDTNVTLTLGGTPATALLRATSITVGWAGTLAVTRGGTGLSAIAQGDIIYGSGVNTYSVLNKNTVATRYLSNTGATNNPAWAQVDLSNGVTGTLPSASLGNGLATSVFGVTGNAAAARADIQATAANQVFVMNGAGTAIVWGTVATGGITNSAVTYAKIQDVTATARFLGRITAGAGVIEELTGTQATSLLDLFSTTTTTKGIVIGSNNVGTSYFLRADGTWAIPPVGGGTNHTLLSATHTDTVAATAVLGDIIYANASPAWQRLAGNITTAKMYLSQTGTSAVSAAPVWASIAGADVTGAALTKTDDTNVTLTLGGTPATALLRATSITVGWTGVLATGRGGTGLSAYVLGDIIYASAANVLSTLAGNTVNAKRFLTQTGTGVVSAAPAWGLIAAADIPDLSATYVPVTRTLTINGSAQTLAADRTWTITVTGTANRITVTGGAGLTPTIDIAATYVGQSSITTVGTITTGTWNGTAIGPTFGGTGITTYTLGDILYASATNTLAKLAGNITTAKQYLSQTGTGTVSAAPAWATITGADITGAALTKTDDTNVTLTLGGTPATALLRAASITVGWTGTLAVTRGGTGLAAVAQGDLLYGSAANVYSLLNKSTTANQYLKNSGTTNNPAWATITAVELTMATNRILGRLTAGTGVVEELTGTQVTTMLDLFSTSSTVKGVVPGSNSVGTTFFLRADGTWAVPAGGVSNHNLLSATHPDTVAGTPVLGDMIYANATPAWQKMSGNTSTGKQFLSQTGTGSVSAAPVWALLTAADIPTGSGNYIQNQNSAAQATSNYWISGNGRINGTLTFGATGAETTTIGATGTVGAGTTFFGDINLAIGTGKHYTFLNSGNTTLWVGSGTAPSTINYAAIIGTDGGTGAMQIRNSFLGNLYPVLWANEGNISLGVNATTTARLYSEYTNPGTYRYGIYSRIQGKAALYGNTAVLGVVDNSIPGAASSTDTAGIKGVIVLQNGATYNYSTSHELSGIHAVAQVNNAGTTADRLVCFKASPIINNGASVGIMYGIKIEPIDFSGGGTVGTYYAVYQESGAAATKNLFMAKTLIGDPTDNGPWKLQVIGTGGASAGGILARATLADADVGVYPAAVGFHQLSTQYNGSNTNINYMYGANANMRFEGFGGTVQWYETFAFKGGLALSNVTYVSGPNVSGGICAAVGVASTATADILAGLKTNIQIEGGGTIGTYYDIYMEGVTGSGSEASITNHWGIYQLADIKNHFAGEVRIGSVTDFGDYRLQVTGGAYINATGKTVKLTLGSDATGDIYYRNSSGDLVRLGVGATGDVLTINTGLPVWQAPAGGGPGGTHTMLSATHTDTTAASVQRGDLITGQGGTPTWQRLAKGTANQYLKSDGTDLSWATITIPATKFGKSGEDDTAAENRSFTMDNNDFEFKSSTGDYGVLMGRRTANTYREFSATITVGADNGQIALNRDGTTGEMFANIGVTYISTNQTARWELGLGYAELQLGTASVFRIQELDEAVGTKTLRYDPGTDLVSYHDIPTGGAARGFSTTATAGGSSTLTVSSNYYQYFTGTSTHILTMPVVSTLALGQEWEVVNLSTGLVTVRSSGGTDIIVLAAGTSAFITCQAITGTGSGSWFTKYMGAIVASGKKLFSNNSMTFNATDGTTWTLPGSISETLVGQTTTQTLTNKRVTQRVNTTASSTSLTIDSDTTDLYTVTALAATMVMNNPSGTPTEGQKLMIRIEDNGTTKTLTWSGSQWRAGEIPLPVGTIAAKIMYLGFMWHVTDSKWDLVAYTDNF